MKRVFDIVNQSRVGSIRDYDQHMHMAAVENVKLRWQMITGEVPENVAWPIIDELERGRFNRLVEFQRTGTLSFLRETPDP